ncbi:MAG: GTP 3',8-cyclase MoaA [Candidatus Binatia bacterium]
MPLDRFQREIDYLRISLTDHCNLRCVYCMPLQGAAYAPLEGLLTAGEIERVARAAASVGFRKIRLTGGEPTLRPDLVDIVRRIARTDGIRDVALTTNGILLPKLAPALADAGLKRVNVHVDSLHPERFARVMRWGKLDDVWAGIEAACAAGFTPLKLNCVVVGGYNEDDVVDMARLTQTRGWHVRFIELMPLGGGECAQVATQSFVSNRDSRRRIEDALGVLEELPTTSPSDESRNFRLKGAAGVIGFISPVSEPYCGSCNRMRLTADGRFHLCLLRDDELDVRAALRDGADDAVIAAILLRAVGAKPTGHDLRHGVSTRERSMHHLGG